MNTSTLSDRILKTVRASRHNHLDLADLGAQLESTPAELLPIVDRLRRNGILTAATREGRYPLTREQAYTTIDGCGIVSIRY